MAGRRREQNILDLRKHVDKRIRVKFQGGRELSGVLKGFDQLVNLVLDETTEYLLDPTDPTKQTGETRALGLIVVRGPGVMTVAPEDGLEELANNPFEDEDEAAAGQE